MSQIIWVPRTFDMELPLCRRWPRIVLLLRGLYERGERVVPEVDGATEQELGQLAQQDHGDRVVAVRVGAVAAGFYQQALG